MTSREAIEVYGGAFWCRRGRRADGSAPTCYHEGCSDAPTFIFETSASNAEEAVRFTLQLESAGFAVRSARVFADCYLLEYWS